MSKSALITIKWTAIWQNMCGFNYKMSSWKVEKVYNRPLCVMEKISATHLFFCCFSPDGENLMAVTDTHKTNNL